jgi:ribosomal protein S18 acetylase RimI-like enzyme
MPLPPGVDVDVMCFLERHETSVHALPGRDIRDLGHAILITDPSDREPFWNRMAALRWPSEPVAFDRRLDEAVTLFATLDRLPHFWPRPALREPRDLVERMTAFGFETVGEGHVMVLTDATEVLRLADAPLPPDTTVERLAMVSGFDLTEVAIDVATVLNESFAVDPERQASIELETETMLQRTELQTFLVRVGGEPAAAAREATLNGATYLSSIGTRPRFRGRGLGALVTSIVAAAGVRAGSRWIHLGVFADNVSAIRMYERLGFERIGDTAPDLILR